MKLKIVSMLLAVVLFGSLFSGCSSAVTGKVDSNVKCYGDMESRKALRICVDIQDFWTSDLGYLDRSIEDFIASLKAQTGIKKVLVEYLPSPITDPTSSDSGEVAIFRKTSLDRLKAEMLAGGGPDVFIVTQMSANLYADLLFPFPQKTMESGLFLPLDEYMKEAKFAEWEKFPKAVMDAGRNSEGQQIIPLTYTLPVLTYPKMIFDYTSDRQLSWDDMINDPQLAPFAAQLADCAETYESDDTHEIIKYYNSHLEFVLGALADYEKEELLFTEEELLQRVNEILAMETEETDASGSAVETTFGKELSSVLDSVPRAMVPIYSDDGGITARIQSFACINRNTQKTEEAFAVIDYLLGAQAQSGSKIYTDFLCYFTSIPMHSDILQESLPLCKSYSLTNDNFMEFCEVRNQITAAHFDSEIAMELSDVLLKCSMADQYGKSVEEIVREAYAEIQRRVRE